MTGGTIKYTLIKKLGSGGMADIHLGVFESNTGFSRPCVIKNIAAEHASSPEHTEQFRREARACQSLQHPNIVGVIGFADEAGKLSLIMEYVHGLNLHDLLTRCRQLKLPLSIPMALHVAREAARGLEYAHNCQVSGTDKQKGIIHRDVSPRNILISTDGQVKVTDFGIARIQGGSHTDPGIIKGSYGYLSPEQVNAQPLDGRTDVFSLCTVLWEMLTLQPLFATENPALTIDKISNCTIPDRLSSYNHAVDKDLDTIVRQGLAKNPSERIPSAAQLAKLTGRHLNRNFPTFEPEKLGTFIQSMLPAETRENQDLLQRNCPSF